MSTVTPLVTEPPAAERAGADLRAARERLGLSLQDVALHLRIRIPHLEALEEGRVSLLPGTAYALAFVRTYANALGLDAEEMVRRFKTEASEFGRQTELVFPVPMPERGLPPGAVVLLGLMLAIGAYAGWYRLSGEGRLPAETVTAIPEHLAPLAEQALPRPAGLAPTGADPTGTAPSGPALAGATGSGPVLAGSGVAGSGVAGSAVAGSGVAGSGVGGSALAGPGSSGPTVANSGPSGPAAGGSAASGPGGSGLALSGHVLAGAVPSGSLSATGPIVESSGASHPRIVLADPATMQPVASPAPPVEAISPTSAAAAQVPPRPADGTPVGASLVPASASVPPAPAAPDASRVVLRASADAWLLVKDRGGSVLLNRTLKAGDAWPVPPRPDLVLTTGNAGGTEILVDGAPTPSLGGSGTVRRDMPLDPEQIKEGKLAGALAPQLASTRARQ